jgi:type VI secretion system secreted protein VgrG
MEGDPDRPVITGRVYNAGQMPPWSLAGQKFLSGLQSREIHGGGRNQLLFDDTKGQIQAQLASDHASSQLNLGYLTRVNHHKGRNDFRGEGFELRTDAWGAVRAANGLLLSTYPRSGAMGHQKDMSESIAQLNRGAKQHRDMAALDDIHNMRNYKDDVEPLARAVTWQANQVEGAGDKHEMQGSHIVLTSPSGIALTTPESTHVYTGEQLAFTSEKNISASSGHGFLVSALQKISMIAHKAGVKLAAARGKVQIHAQTDNLELVADKNLEILSVKSIVHISAPKEILLTAGGSYIKIGASGIEQGSNGKWEAKAAGHSMSGPGAMPYLRKIFSSGDMQLPGRVSAEDELGRYINVDEGLIKVRDDGLELFLETGGMEEKTKVVQIDDKTKVYLAKTNKVKVE